MENRRTKTQTTTILLMFFVQLDILYFICLPVYHYENNVGRT